MTSDIDAAFARQAMKKSLRRWRFFSVFLLIAIGLTIFIRSISTNAEHEKDHIARVSFEGEIVHDRSVLNMLKEINDSPHVKAVILEIDSPGGGTTASEEIYEAIRKISQKRPVVSVMQTVAASGGYLTALSGDYIVARGNTITGSIGVLFQWPKVEKLLDKVGISVDEIKSGELKAEPTFFKEPSLQTRHVLESMVKDSFDWFTGLVSERRKLPMPEVLRLSDGRVYTGRQALKVKLIDALGGENEALSWLKEKRKISSALSVVDWEPVQEEESGFWPFLKRGFSALTGKMLDQLPSHLAQSGLYIIWKGDHVN